MAILLSGGRLVALIVFGIGMMYLCLYFGISKIIQNKVERKLLKQELDDQKRRNAFLTAHVAHLQESMRMKREARWVKEGEDPEPW